MGNINYLTTSNAESDADSDTVSDYSVPEMDLDMDTISDYSVPNMDLETDTVSDYSVPDLDLDTENPYITIIHEESPDSDGYSS